MNYIAPEGCALVFRVKERSVSIVLLGRQGEWNVIASAWEAETVLRRVMKDVETCLTEIGVLCGVVDGVIMVPESTSTLLVRIVW
jgi:hypothetical protein